MLGNDDQQRAVLLFQHPLEIVAENRQAAIGTKALELAVIGVSEYVRIPGKQGSRRRLRIGLIVIKLRGNRHNIPVDRDIGFICRIQQTMPRQIRQRNRGLVMVRLETGRPLKAVVVNAIRVLDKKHLVHLLVPPLIVRIGVTSPLKRTDALTFT